MHAQEIERKAGEQRKMEENREFYSVLRCMSAW